MSTLKKLAVGFFIPILFMVGFGAWQISLNSQFLLTLEKIKISVENMSIVQQMDKDVVQVQQWLTDISATRGLDGLDDGFKEAEISYKSFLKGVSHFEALYKAEGLEQNLKQMLQIRNSAKAYYEMGKSMAEAYIADGPKGGNRKMSDFDTVAENIQKVLIPFKTEQEVVLNEAVQRITTSVLKAKSQLLFAVLTLVLCLFGVGYKITQSITGPLGGEPSEMNKIAQLVAQGDLKNVAIDTNSKGLKQAMNLMAESLNSKAELVEHII